MSLTVIRLAKAWFACLGRCVLGLGEGGVLRSFGLLSPYHLPELDSGSMMVRRRAVTIY